MKNLRRQIRGRLLAGAPQNDLERHMWEAFGYQLLPTGDWCELEEPIGPSLEFMRRYPHGHVCKSCLDHFRSTEYHDAFCQSCRSIMDLTRKEIDLFWIPLAIVVSKQIGRYSGRYKKFWNVPDAFGMQMKDEPNRPMLI